MIVAFQRTGGGIRMGFWRLGRAVQGDHNFGSQKHIGQRQKALGVRARVLVPPL